MVFVILAFCAIPLLIGMIPKGYWIVWRLRADGYHIDYSAITGDTSLGAPMFRCVSMDFEKTITNETLEQLTQLPHLEWVQLIHVDCDALDLNWLIKIPKLKLILFNICYHLREEEIQKLGECSHLSCIFIDKVPVSGETIRQWEKLPLQELGLGDCSLTDSELEQIVSTFPDLIYLNVRYNSEITDAAWEHLAKLERIECIDLTGTSVTQEEIGKFLTKYPNPKLIIRYTIPP